MLSKQNGRVTKKDYTGKPGTDYGEKTGSPNYHIPDTENITVLTGSNAHLISREIATFLKGRSLETTIYPFLYPAVEKRNSSAKRLHH